MDKHEHLKSYKLLMFTHFFEEFLWLFDGQINELKIFDFSPFVNLAPNFVFRIFSKPRGGQTENEVENHGNSVDNHTQ